MRISILTLLIGISCLLAIFSFNVNITSASNLITNPTDDTFVQIAVLSGDGQNTNFNGQNLTIGSYYTNTFSRAYLMFNISELNVAGYVTSVQNAEFSVYIYRDFYRSGYEPDVNVNLSVYEVYNTLNEDNPTWNNQFCDHHFTNNTNCNLTKIDYIFYPRTIAFPHTASFPNWSYWDITKLIQRKIGSDTTTLAIWLENDTTLLTVCGTGDGSGCRVFAYDTENSETLAPKLNITYTLTPLFFNELISPITNTQTNSLINYTANLSCYNDCQNATLYFANSTSIIYSVFTDLTGINQINLGNEIDLSDYAIDGSYAWYYEVFDTLSNSALTNNHTIIVNTTEQINVEDTEIYQQMASAGAGLGIFTNNIAIPLMNFLLIEFLVILIIVIVCISLAHSLKHYIVHLSES
jgi:hypothetical protein